MRPYDPGPWHESMCAPRPDARNSNPAPSTAGTAGEAPELQDGRTETEIAPPTCDGAVRPSKRTPRASSAAAQTNSTPTTSPTERLRSYATGIIARWTRTLEHAEMHETPTHLILSALPWRVTWPGSATSQPHTPMPNRNRKPNPHPDGGRGVAGLCELACEEPARRLAVSTN